MGIVIAIIGYSATAIFAVVTVACLVGWRRAAIGQEDMELSDIRQSFFIGVVLTLVFAVLTRWLTGGLF